MRCITGTVDAVAVKLIGEIGIRVGVREPARRTCRRRYSVPGTVASLSYGGCGPSDSSTQRIGLGRGRRVGPGLRSGGRLWRRGVNNLPAIPEPTVPGGWLSRASHSERTIQGVEAVWRWLWWTPSDDNGQTASEAGGLVTANTRPARSTNATGARCHDRIIPSCESGVDLVPDSEPAAGCSRIRSQQDYDRPSASPASDFHGRKGPASEHREPRMPQWSWPEWPRDGRGNQGPGG